MQDLCSESVQGTSFMSVSCVFPPKSTAVMSPGSLPAHTHTEQTCVFSEDFMLLHISGQTLEKQNPKKKKSPSRSCVFEFMLRSISQYPSCVCCSNIHPLCVCGSVGCIFIQFILREPKINV